jgi:hypothetical protein
MIIGNVLVQFLGCVVFFARVYSRAIIIKAWKTEDSMLALAWVSHRGTGRPGGLWCDYPHTDTNQILCTGYSVCQYGQIRHGAGRHSAAIIMQNPQDPITSQQYAFAAQIILIPALATSKLSICLTYLRIFYADTWGRRLIKCLMFLLILHILPFDFEAIFQCSPIHVYWTEGRPFGKCLPDIIGLLIQGSLNAFVDASLMIIVLPRILELQLHARQRWALTLIVLLGSLAIAASIMRMVRVAGAVTMPGFEPSWDAYDVSIWSATEAYVSLICAAAPGVKPVVVKLIPRILGSSLRSHTTQGPSIELGLGSKWKRTTIGSARVHHQPNDSVLGTGVGPYTQVESFNASSEGVATSVVASGEHAQGGHLPSHAR